MSARTAGPATRARIFKRDKYVCRYCGNLAEELDHVTPYWKKPSNHSNDLVSCCVDCNAVAGDRLFDSFAEKQAWIRAAKGLGPATHISPGPTDPVCICPECNSPR